MVLYRTAWALWATPPYKVIQEPKAGGNSLPIPEAE